MSEEQKMPSVWEMMQTFVGSVTEWVAEGAPVVSKEDYAERLSDCNSCEHLIRKSMRCGECGCKVEYKARMKTKNCPIGIWKPQTFEDGEIEEGDNPDTGNKV